MRELQRTLISIFFCCELTIFIFMYAFGTHGIQAVRHIQYENEKARYENNQLKEDIQKLQQECSALELPFYKEKIAREHLQMAYADDIIYIVQ